ncbi:MAG: hypothetical protein R2864_03685 [Syntrophotaleaceae bacterium]
MMMSVPLTQTLLLGSALLTTGCSLVLALRVRRLKRQLGCCRTELRQREAAETVEPEIRKTPAPDFSGSLQQATLKQRLLNGPDWRQPLEKYRYASALAEQGMDASGIAAVLQFPLEEAQQLIALKRAAQAQQNRTGTEKPGK